MGTLVRLNDFRGEAHGPFFDRRELKAILELYGERVSLGEWRDYAIDQRPGRVGFAVFRHSFDWPLFVIAKFRAGTNRLGDYAVYAGPRRIALGRSIDDVLARLRAELAPAAAG